LKLNPNPLKQPNNAQFKKMAVV